MFTIHVVPQDIPLYRRQHNPDNMCFADVTTESVRRQQIVNRVRHYARRINAMLILNELADAAHELDIWPEVSEEISEANARICRQYQWAKVRNSKGEMLLVEDGRDVMHNRHFLVFENDGYRYCGEAAHRYVKRNGNG